MYRTNTHEVSYRECAREAQEEQRRQGAAQQLLLRVDNVLTECKLLLHYEHYIGEQDCNQQQGEENEGREHDAQQQHPSTDKQIIRSVIQEIRSNALL